MEGRMPKASAALANAQRVRANDSARVGDLIDALAARYTTETTFNLDGLNTAYAQRMKALMAKYPGDDEIATLYAESLILSEPPPAAHTHHLVNAAALDVVESVLARKPKHLGANHYHIHLLEAVDHMRALPSARRLDDLHPEAGHLLHMPSHIYLRIGDYHGAVRSNRRAFDADRAARTETGTFPAMGYHTREFLAAAAGFTGQSAIAKEADDSLFVQLRFNRWSDILQRRQPARGVSRLEWHIATVLALVGSGRLADAEAVRADYAAFEAELPRDITWWADPIEAFLPMARHEMDARLAWATGDRAASIAFWEQAVASQDRLTRLESVMPWFHSLRESLGAALLVSGRAAEAEQVFREDLRINPGNGRSLFGLAESLKAQGRSRESAAVQRQFTAAWKNADVTLSLESL
jgi:tetratricopeptide (TPR) repeat protein